VAGSVAEANFGGSLPIPATLDAQVLDKVHSIPGYRGLTDLDDEDTKVGKDNNWPVQNPLQLEHQALRFVYLALLPEPHDIRLTFAPQAFPRPQQRALLET